MSTPESEGSAAELRYGNQEVLWVSAGWPQQDTRKETPYPALSVARVQLTGVGAAEFDQTDGGNEIPS
jgi:hypothetical protein